MSETKTKKPSESSGNGTTHGYYIEARCEDDWVVFGLNGPPKVGEQHIGHRWVRLHFSEDPHCGVVNDVLDAIARQKRILTYVAARALMATVAARFSWRHHVEFRLVKVEVKTSYTITVMGHSEPENFGHDTEREVEFAPPPDSELLSPPSERKEK